MNDSMNHCMITENETVISSFDGDILGLSANK